MSSVWQAEKVDTTRMLITVGGMNNVASCNKICAKRPNTSSEKDTVSVDDCALVANHSKSDLEKLQVLLDSKGKLLSQTTLSALIRKRNELALQQRKIEDEIAMCDKKIQRMLTVYGEDDFELKIESIMEGCNDIWVRNQGRTVEHQSLPPCTKRKKLSEAVFIVQSPCQVEYYGF